MCLRDARNELIVIVTIGKWRVTSERLTIERLGCSATQVRRKKREKQVQIERKYNKTGRLNELVSTIDHLIDPMV